MKTVKSTANCLNICYQTIWILILINFNIEGLNILSWCFPLFSFLFPQQHLLLGANQDLCLSICTALTEIQRTLFEDKFGQFIFCIRAQNKIVFSSKKKSPKPNFLSVIRYLSACY